ncbi:MAG: tetratricopeptide repeat protein [Acidobacteriota bacterium]
MTVRVAPDEAMPRMLTVLASHLEASGRGTAARIETELGMRAGYLSQLRGRGSIRIPVLVRVLDALGMDRTLFMTEVFGPPRERFGSLAMRCPNTSCPEIVMAFLDGIESTPVVTTPSPLIDRLDLADRSHAFAPRPATRIATRILHRALLGDAHLAIHALAVWASCRRLLGHHQEAHHALRAAIHGARDSDSTPDLLDRCIHWYEDHALHHDALAASEWLLRTHTTDGDIQALARTLLTHGRLLAHLERIDEARQSFTGALRLLSDDARRAPAHLGLAYIDMIRGQLDDARHHLDHAASRVVTCRHHLLVDWLRSALTLGGTPPSHRALDALQAIPRPRVTAYLQIETVRIAWRADRSPHLVDTVNRDLRHDRVTSDVLMDIIAAQRLARLDEPLLAGSEWLLDAFDALEA